MACEVAFHAGRPTRGRMLDGMARNQYPTSNIQHLTTNINHQKYADVLTFPKTLGFAVLCAEDSDNFDEKNQSR